MATAAKPATRRRQGTWEPKLVEHKLAHSGDEELARNGMTRAELERALHEEDANDRREAVEGERSDRRASRRATVHELHGATKRVRRSGRRAARTTGGTLRQVVTEPVGGSGGLGGLILGAVFYAWLLNAIDGKGGAWWRAKFLNEGPNGAPLGGWPTSPTATAMPVGTPTVGAPATPGGNVRPGASRGGRVGAR